MVSGIEGREAAESSAPRRAKKLRCGCGLLLFLAACGVLAVFSGQLSNFLLAPPVCGEEAYSRMRRLEPEDIYFSEPDVEQVGRFLGGVVRQMLVRESDGFATIGLNLVWLDFSHPAHPRLNANLKLPYAPTLVHVDEKRPEAFITVGSDLWLVDFSDPHRPAMNHMYDAPDQIYEAKFVNDHAYVYIETCGVSASVEYCRNGFHRVDFSSNEFASGADGCYPGLLGDLAAKVVFFGAPSSAQTSSGYEFINAGREGIRVRKIDDSGSSTEVGSYDPPFGVVKMAVIGEFAYLAEPGGDLYIVDISEPSQPRQVGIYDGSSDFTELAHENGTHLYAITNDGSTFEVLDVTSPSSPRVVSAIQARNTFLDVELSQGMAYLLDDDLGVFIVDAAEPDEPKVVGSYPAKEVVDFAVAGRMLYLLIGETREKELHIVNIALPAAPELLSIVPLEYSLAIAITDDLVIIPRVGGELYLVDVSTPTEPQVHFDMRLQFFVSLSEIFVDGQYAIFLSASGRSVTSITIADVSDPTQPRQISRIRRSGDVSDIEFSDDNIFVAKISEGFEILRLIDAE